MEQKKELVIFETKDHAVKLEVPVNEETVWLNRQLKWPSFLIAMSKYWTACQQCFP